MPGKPENRESVKGMMKAHKSAGSETIAREENMVGSSDSNGIRFKVHDHPDMSRVRSPEKK